MTRKKKIEWHEPRMISLGVPKSWQVLSEKISSQAGPLLRSMVNAINNMLIDQMAEMS